MGFFDVHCAVSGVPLLGQQTAAWLVRAADGAPLTLPVCGEYDRLGSIEVPRWGEDFCDTLNELYLKWVESGRTGLWGFRGRADGAESELKRRFGDRVREPITV